METYTMEKAIQKAVKIPPIAYSYHGAESLTIKKDIPYCHQNAIAQTFDVYYPKDFQPFQRKTVLFVNGGGPIKQDYKSYPCFTSWKEFELCIHPNGVHGFDYANDDEYTREIIEKTLAFIKR